MATEGDRLRSAVGAFAEELESDPEAQRVMIVSHNKAEGMVRLMGGTLRKLEFKMRPGTMRTKRVGELVQGVLGDKFEILVEEFKPRVLLALPVPNPLPAEILRRVFSVLQLKELARAGAVCREWRMPAEQLLGANKSLGTIFYHSKKKQANAKGAVLLLEGMGSSFSNPEKQRWTSIVAISNPEEQRWTRILASSGYNVLVELAGSGVGILKPLAVSLRRLELPVWFNQPTQLIGGMRNDLLLVADVRSGCVGSLSASGDWIQLPWSLLDGIGIAGPVPVRAERLISALSPKMCGEPGFEFMVGDTLTLWLSVMRLDVAMQLEETCFILPPELDADAQFGQPRGVLYLDAKSNPKVVEVGANGTTWLWLWDRANLSGWVRVASFAPLPQPELDFLDTLLCGTKLDCHSMMRVIESEEEFFFLVRGRCELSVYNRPAASWRRFKLPGNSDGNALGLGEFHLSRVEWPVQQAHA